MKGPTSRGKCLSASRSPVSYAGDANPSYFNHFFYLTKTPLTIAITERKFVCKILNFILTCSFFKIGLLTFLNCILFNNVLEAIFRTTHCIVLCGQKEFARLKQTLH